MHEVYTFNMNMPAKKGTVYFKEFLHESITFPVIVRFEYSRQSTNTDPFETHHTCISWKVKETHHVSTRLSSDFRLVNIILLLLRQSITHIVDIRSYPASVRKLLEMI